MQNTLFNEFKPNTKNHFSKSITVTQLNLMARDCLESSLGTVNVEGEISNLSKPASGHIYFTLKDKRAQLRCAWFKGRQSRQTIQIKHGQQINVRGSVSIYSERGDYQMIVEQVQQSGQGALEATFLELKNKLEAKGWFDERNKQTLPSVIKHLGIITSATGAALQDVLSILKRRFALLPITVFNSQVQGAAAPNELMQALTTAENHPDVDVIMITRGGGSLEDLWAFNHEALAEMIFECHKPIISAVGHEVDFTIADFVADLRAPTPSAAAELVSPNAQDYLAICIRSQQILQRRLSQLLVNLNWRVQQLSKRLRDPKQQLKSHKIQIQHQRNQLLKVIHRKINQHKYQYKQLTLRLKLLSPNTMVQQQRHSLTRVYEQLCQQMQNKLQTKRTYLILLLDKLDILSPTATLRRGFSITTNNKQEVIRSVIQVKKNEELYTKLADGELISIVKKITAV